MLEQQNSTCLATLMKVTQMFPLFLTSERLSHSIPPPAPWEIWEDPFYNYKNSSKSVVDVMPLFPKTSDERQGAQQMFAHHSVTPTTMGLLSSNLPFS